MARSAPLTAKLRDERGKGPAKRMRRAGRIPAVIYGGGDADTRALSIDQRDLEHLFAEVSVENTIIELDIEDDEADAVRTLIREVQTHPYKPEILHVDFYKIRAGQELIVDIPIRLVGTAEGVREGGILQQALYDLEIRCLPDQIPERVEADVSELEIGDSLHIRDLVLPEGVKVEVDGDRTLCSIVEPTVITIDEEPEEPEGLEGELEPELIDERAEEEEEPPATEEGGHEGEDEPPA